MAVGVFSYWWCGVMRRLCSMLGSLYSAGPANPSSSVGGGP